MHSIDELSGMVVDEAIQLHRELGPGWLGSVCEVVLAGRLEAKGLKVAREVPVPLVIDGHLMAILISPVSAASWR